MVDYYSVIETAQGGTNYDVGISDLIIISTGIETRYVDEIKKNGRIHEISLYVCDKDIVYDNMPVIHENKHGITESWLLNNSAYIHNFNEQTLIDIKISEEMCSGSTYDIGAVVSQQMIVRLYRNDDYLNNCTVPDDGYTDYFENKCLIAFSRLALHEDENGNVTHWGSVPIGVFYVNDIKGDFIIELTCYDKMLHLEKKMMYQNLEYIQAMSKMVSNFKVPTSVYIEAAFSRVLLFDKSGELIKVPTGLTYRDLLKYTAFTFDDLRSCGFVGFDRYGVLDVLGADFNSEINLDLLSITSDDIMQSNYSNSNIQRDCRTIKVEFGDDNEITINNGYPVTSSNLEYFREGEVLASIENFAASQENALIPCTMQLHGFPCFTPGDLLKVTLQDKTFDTETGEYSYTDKEPFYIKIHKQELTIGSSIAQTVQCFDVNTENISVASNNNGIDIPTQDGLLNVVFDVEKFSFSNPNTREYSMIDFDKKTHYQYDDDDVLPRHYYIFATTKATRPSKIFPPGVDYSQLYSGGSGTMNIAAYCTSATNTYASWIGFKLFNVSNESDQLMPDAYVTQDYLLVDDYEEYHENEKGHIIFDDFIIQWGKVNVSTVSDSGSNEYYADLYYTAELNEEPNILLMPLSRAPGTVDSFSYYTISNDVPITKGVRIYLHDTNMAASGIGVQFIIFGRVKSA